MEYIKFAPSDTNTKETYMAKLKSMCDMLKKQYRHELDPQVLYEQEMKRRQSVAQEQ